MVPMSTKEASALSRRRNRVMRPMERTPTTGQNRSSKRKKTLREAMSRLRRAKAQVATTSPCQRGSLRQLNEHLLQVGLAHLDVAHHHGFRVEAVQELGQSLLGRVHGALEPAVDPGDPQDSLRLGDQGARPQGIQAQRDHVAEAELALELV